MSVIVDFFKAVAGICQTRPASPESWRLDGNKATVRVGEVPELQSTGGAVYLKGKGLKIPVLIVRDEDNNYRCFSNQCTHFGRKLDPVPGKSVLRCCSVNHSTFDLQGAKLTGPAKKPIQVYPAELEDGNLVIIV